MNKLANEKLILTNITNDDTQFIICTKIKTE